MKLVTVEELIRLAQDCSEKKIAWHHHFLTPKCTLNDSNKFKIIFESEQELCYSEFDHKPMKELEQLENLFFDRKQA